MSITNGYCTLSDLRNELGITDSDDDRKLESVIEAVSRAIDSERGRRFYAATETRYYGATSADYVITDDLLSITTLKTDEDADGTYERTWTTSDYTLLPFNAATDGKPYIKVQRAPLGSYYFPTEYAALEYKGVQITGSFGYSSTAPAAIKRACLLMGMRVFKRKDMIFGTSGNASLGTVEAIIPLFKDGEFQRLLNTVKKRWA